MSKTKVAIVRCESYDEDVVYDALKRAIKLIGGIEPILSKDKKILLKVNCLAGVNSSEAVTTHPSILDATIRIIKDKHSKTKDIELTYGDSPGFGKPEASLTTSGFKTVADTHNIRLGDFENGQIKSCDGHVSKTFEIANACLEVDGIISLSKMKTHMLAKITGAVKNQFGCVYGLHKASFHAKIPNPTHFSQMLVDLTLLLKPRLYIMDGIVAMEGNGPRSGTPVNMNCIIVSTDPIAVDSTFCRMINIDPMNIPTIRYGKMYGLGNYDLEYLEYVGDPIESFTNPNFKIDRKPVSNNLFKSIMPAVVRNQLYPKPMIDPAKCVKCGICVSACPVEGKALNFQDAGKDSDKNLKAKKDLHANPPVYDYTKCIRCYCCQEMCPHHAIYVK